MTSEHEHATSDPGRSGDESDTEEVPHQSDSEHINSRSRSRSKSPAYVAPIPKIGPIPPVAPGIGLQISPSDRPAIPASIGSLLVGKLVDEDGDIIDEKTGTLLAHAGGDLPSIVGRRVSNTRGDILADDGNELLGYVADIEVPKAAAAQAPPRSLFDLMGRATSSLMVDHQGNILDATGAVVGRFHDNNNPLHRKEREEREARQREEATQSHQQTETREDGQRPQQRSPLPTPSRPAPPQQEQESHSTSASASGDGQRRPPRRTEEERRQNAEAWRKENPGETPSDIFLDVKSTAEGIQLTIRIPTVFNGQQRTPHISFS